MKKLAFLFLLVSVLLVGAPILHAQEPAPAASPAPTPVWSGNFGAGLALTGGNTDTKNFNLSADVLRDPKKDSTLRAKLIYLRGDQNGILTVNRLNVEARDEQKVSKKIFVFVQADYTKDAFKNIDYLWSPTGGLGYTFVHTDRTQFALDTGAGGVWEKDTGRTTVFSGAYNAAERFSLKISKTATIMQSVSSLWKMNDWNDSLINSSIGLAASVTHRTELKIEFLDSYKNLPGSPTVKKNDTSLVTAFVVKF